MTDRQAVGGVDQLGPVVLGPEPEPETTPESLVGHARALLQRNVLHRDARRPRFLATSLLVVETFGDAGERDLGLLADHRLPDAMETVLVGPSVGRPREVEQELERLGAGAVRGEGRASGPIGATLGRCAAFPPPPSSPCSPASPAAGLAWPRRPSSRRPRGPSAP